MTEWWKEMFEGAWQGVQLSPWWEEGTAADVDRVESALELARGSRVLDVPCGAGRVALELAARGHRVTGVDATAAFLSEAERRAIDRKLSIRWEQRDMRDLPWKSQFDAAINFGGSFGYFSDEENERFLAAVAAALRPGGRFLIDTPSLETIYPSFSERDWFAADDVLVFSETSFDIETCRVKTTWTFVAENGLRETSVSSIRLYSYAELASSLRSVGFSSLVGFDSELKPFKIGSPRLILVSTKAA